MENPLKKIKYYFSREKNPEKAHFIAENINNILNRIYSYFPEKKLSELAEWFDDLFVDILKIIEKNSKTTLRILPTIEERHFILYGDEMERLTSDSRLSQAENGIILGIYQLIENINQELTKFFFKGKRKYLWFLIFLRELEVRATKTYKTKWINNIIEFYKEIFKNTFLEVINNIAEKQNIGINNREEIIEQYLNFYFLDHQIQLREFLSPIANNLEEQLKDEDIEEEEIIFNQFLVSKENRQNKLEFYIQLSENYINDLKDEFRRSENYQQHQDDIEYFLSKLKKIIENLKIVPDKLHEFRGIIFYLANKLYYLFTDNRIMELIFQIKQDDLRKILDPNRPEAASRKEFTIYLSEIKGFPFYVNVLKEIITRIYFKLPEDKRFLRKFNIGLENSSEFNLLNDLIKDYTEHSIGINFSYRERILYKYYQVFNNRIRERYQRILEEPQN